MSLFGDLPEPEGTNGGLFDDLPAADRNQAAQEELDDDANPISKRPKRVDERAIVTTSGHAERRGERDEMQDACTIIDNLVFDKLLSPDVAQGSYYAIFDGHAGVRAARYAANHLHIQLCKRLKKDMDGKALKRTLNEVYHQVDREFLAKASSQHPHWKDGCTAASCLIYNNTLVCGNLGDTKAILVRDKEDKDTGPRRPIATTAQTLLLTKDHSPTVYEERQRIQKAGGQVENGRVQGILEVARSIGDGRFKSLGVTCAPHMIKLQLTSKDRFLLLACDGLWAALTVAEAIEFVIASLNQSLEDTQLESPAQRAQHVAAKLVNQAVHKGSSDNVSVVIVLLNVEKTESDNT
eukprot:TRINITY_DN9912_c0_g1_i1.p1 TRINITY_DN9912_c0_g1~~TRINITY_DN9912_c0_g1_i1.p1  ORF type:complete len:352 (+),score=68.70 TRINITY_DN9912_c0_g1_i1:45-1100(+)